MKMKTFIQGIAYLLFLAEIVNSAAVCSLKTLKMELRQDLADNGMLDCLRVIDPPHSVVETEEQKNLRLAAQWDSSCSFEASSNWMEKLKEHYQIPQLVDSIGEPVTEDYEEQADLCEIIRAGVAKNLIGLEEVNMQKLSKEWIDTIDCAGLVSTDKNGSRICAASGTSFFAKESWTIFLGPTTIQWGGNPKPEQSTEVSDSYESNPTTSGIIKDLMKFTPEMLEKNQLELSEIIDRAKEPQEKKDTSEENPNCQSQNKTIVHAHVKKVDSAQFAPSATPGTFDILEGATERFSLEEERIVFGFYMACFNMETQGTLSLKMNLEKEMPESRQTLGPVGLASLSSGFVQVYPALQDKEYQVEVLYDADAKGSMMEDSEYNLSFGAITFPKGAVVKHQANTKLEFFKASKFTRLDNFEINFSTEADTPKLFMVISSFSFKQKLTEPLHMRLVDVSSHKLQHLPLTTGTISPSDQGSVNMGFIWGKVAPKKHQKFGVAYKYTGEPFIIDDFTDNHFSQTISAFELNSGAQYQVLHLSNPVVLNTQGEWRSFGFKHKLSVECKMTVLILYNVNLRTDGKEMTVRVRYGIKYNKHSMLRQSGTDYAHLNGYVIKILKKGEYEVDIDFKSDSDNIFTPENSSPVSEQTVMLQIVILEGK